MSPTIPTAGDDPSSAVGRPSSAPGPLALARLLCGVSVDEAEHLALPEPWRSLAAVVRDVPHPNRVAALKAALAGRPDALAITAALFALDPSTLAPAPGPSPAAAETHPSPSPISRLPSPDWPLPVPFGEVELPPFPADALPPWLRDFVLAEATATQTPPDLAGMLALAVLSAACAGRFVVRPWGDWTEPVNLYVLVVLPPGHRKSAVFASLTRPLQDFEVESDRQLAAGIARAENRRVVAAQALHNARIAAARAAPAERPDRLAAVERLAAELARLPVPPRPRLIADDCTPERLATLLHEQGGRIAVMSPEGGVFDLMAGRYSHTGAPSFDHFLKGHAGDPIVVDRVGRPADLVPRPAITMGLAVQPDVLRGLMARPGFHGRGLLARFLYALPASPLGRRAIDPPPVPDPIRFAYHAHVRALLYQGSGAGDQGSGQPLPSLADSRPPSPDPSVLTLTGPAAKRLKAFAHDVEPRLAEFGDLDRLVDWGSKLVGAVARLAALLHLAHHAIPAPPAGPSPPIIGGPGGPWPGGLPISDETVAAAVALGEYATAHARAAYAAMGSDPAVDDARYLLRWLERSGAVAFSRRDIFLATRARFPQVEALAPALIALEQRGYIRRRPPPARHGFGRKPSPIYDVNPHLRPAPARAP